MYVQPLNQTSWSFIAIILPLRQYFWGRRSGRASTHIFTNLDSQSHKPGTGLYGVGNLSNYGVRPLPGQTSSCLAQSATIIILPNILSVGIPVPQAFSEARPGQTAMHSILFHGVIKRRTHHGLLQTIPRHDVGASDNSPNGQPDRCFHLGCPRTFMSTSASTRLQQRHPRGCPGPGPLVRQCVLEKRTRDRVNYASRMLTTTSGNTITTTCGSSVLQLLLPSKPYGPRVPITVSSLKLGRACHG